MRGRDQRPVVLINPDLIRLDCRLRDRTAVIRRWTIFSIPRFGRDVSCDRRQLVFQIEGNASRLVARTNLRHEINTSPDPLQSLNPEINDRLTEKGLFSA